jgi:hypothetical protein
MDIHKPKPWHSLGEFLKEYVIIVIGVLTALGAEQAAEALHWRHLAERHENELHTSAQFVALNAIQRLAVDGCLRGELETVGEQLRQPGEAWRGLNPNATGLAADWLPPRLRSPGRAWAHAAWDSALGDGSLTHLPNRAVNAYALLFETSKDVGEVQTHISEEMAELTPLAFDQTLSPQDKARYVAMVARADRTILLMDNMARSVLSQAAQSDFWPPRALITPQIEAARKSLGDCVVEAPRSDFVAGGRQAAPLTKLWPQGS